MFLNKLSRVFRIPTTHFHRTIFVVFRRIFTKLLLVSYIYETSVYKLCHNEILTEYLIASALSKCESRLFYSLLFLFIWHFSFEKSILDGSLLREYFKTLYNKPHHDSVLKFDIDFCDLLFDINILNNISWRTFISLLSYFWKFLINIF